MVPSAARRQWLQRLARETAALDGWQKGWVVDLPALEREGLDSQTWPLTTAVAPSSVAALACESRPRQCQTPVGSPEWLELLGSGGGEELREMLRS